MHTANLLLSLCSPRTPLPLGDSALYANFVFYFPLQQVVSAVRASVNPSGNASNQTSLWDISSSFFFAGTVITTIGKSINSVLLFSLCRKLLFHSTCMQYLLKMIQICKDIHFFYVEMISGLVNTVFDTKLFEVRSNFDVILAWNCTCIAKLHFQIVHLCAYPFGLLVTKIAKYVSDTGLHLRCQKTKYISNKAKRCLY